MHRPENKLILIIISLITIGLFYSGCVSYPRKSKEGSVDKRVEAFGVLDFLCWNHSWNNYQYPDLKALEKTVRLMKEAGIKFVRMDFLWQDLEAMPGKWDFSKYDGIVSLLNKYDIKILGLIGYCADWASPCRKWNFLGDDFSLFLNYAGQVVKHYKGRVNYWEVWNEPDSSVYWEKQDGLQVYCALLKEAYKVIKAANPGCYVLNGGLTNGLANINRMYDNQARDYFDILNIHIFEDPKDPNAIKKATAYVNLAYKVMKRNGDANKKIWITEIGCPGVKKDIKVDNWWLGDNPDENEQAEWVSRVYGELLKIDCIDKVFWAFFRDTKEHWWNGVDYFGLISNDFSPKASFLAYKSCVNKWNKVK